MLFQFYNENIVDNYLEQLEKEIRTLYKGEELKTIYIGGGTPSCLSVKQLEKLFEIINLFKKSNNVEFTIECNFSNTTIEKLELFKKYGINRISFGLETTNSKQLKFLEREENSEKTKKIICNLGSATLGIYLIHVMFVQAFSDRFMIATNYAYPFASVLIAILIFVCGYVVTSIVKKIPFVGKWIV